jgi:hypothetical protein
MRTVVVDVGMGKIKSREKKKRLFCAALLRHKEDRN